MNSIQGMENVLASFVRKIGRTGIGLRFDLLDSGIKTFQPADEAPWL